MWQQLTWQSWMGSWQALEALLAFAEGQKIWEMEVGVVQLDSL